MMLLDWWLEKMQFDQEFMTKLHSTRDSNLFQVDVSYEQLEQRYRDILNFENDRHISFWENATGIIDELFKRHVDDNTLVITTRSEHPSVVENLDKCKNVLKITSDDYFDDRYCIEKEMQKYDKIFVYTIGLSMGNNYRTPDFLHGYLRKCARGKKIVTVLDSVQELFMLPRDYSQYDYVIGTAHALIPAFNMGIVISKDLFQQDLQNGYDFLVMMERLLTKRDLICMFNYVMSEHFSKYMMMDKNLSKTTNCPHIFTLVDKMGRIDGIQEIKGMRPKHSIVSFRACNDFINMDRFKEKIRLVENALENG